MNITAVFFDMGGTLEDVRYDRALRRAAMPGILAVLRRAGIILPADLDAILDTIILRNTEYKAWSEEHEVELPPICIWADWNLCDFGISRNVLEPIAEELSYLWETTFFSRILRSDAQPTLEALDKLGYRLGVISNTSSRTQVFRTLDNYGIAHYFEYVVLSSIEGIRKPAQAIFDIALNRMGVSAGSATYVGDTLSRDVIGAKRAGFALSIQIKSFLTDEIDTKLGSCNVRPDYFVTSLMEIPDILEHLQ